MFGHASFSGAPFSSTGETTQYKTVSATSAGSVVLARSVGKFVRANCAGVVAFGGRSVTHTVGAASTGSVAVRKAVGATVAVLGSSSALVVKSAGKAIAASVLSLVSIAAVFYAALSGLASNISMRSGFRTSPRDLVKEWTGYVVAWWEADERHPQELVRGRPDMQSVHDPRPEQPDTFLSTNEVTKDDL